MSLTFKLRSHDQVYHSLDSEKILLNKQDSLNSENKALLDQLIMKNYREDNLSLVPSCACGDISGTYYVGEMCPKCHTRVTSSSDENISFLLWLRRPESVERFISPIILSILIDRYKITKPSVSLVKYIMLPSLRVETSARKNKHKLERLDTLLASRGIKRGYNSFVENFFEIVEILEMEFGTERKALKEKFLNWLYMQRGRIFSEYLPFPNRIVFAIDSNELGDFIDKSLLDPLNAMRRVTGIDLHSKPSNVKQAKVAKTLIDLAGFYVNYTYSAFFIKPGLIRKHISSTRSHFTLRATIVSIQGPHVYDEIHLPWSYSCTLFREHILGQLRKLGLSYKKAVNHFMYHNRIYCPIIDSIFKDIIRCSGDGVQVMFNRNPSLHRGSIQRVRITQIKTNPVDCTIGMSFLIAKAFNADFDGKMVAVVKAS